MATVTPSSTNSIQPFRFLDLSPELRNKIYELVLGFDRPVTLTRTTDVYRSHTNYHINSCASYKHQELPNLNRGAADRDQATWCVDPYTNVQRKLDYPRSVLNLRHVCKQIDEEMRYIFFAINEFHFRNAALAWRAFDQMADTKAMEAIQVMGFRFYGDNAPKMYPALAKACPNLRVLKVSMDVNMHVAISGPDKTLRRARGVEAFASYIAGLEKLETFEIVGTDNVKEIVNGVETWVQVDINHPLAVGSWFREKIEKGKRTRELFGKEMIENNRRWKEALEKAMKEKRKEQRKKSEARRAERERERLRLEAERLEKERKEARRLERQNRKLEKLRNERLEKENQERHERLMERMRARFRLRFP